MIIHCRAKAWVGLVLYAWIIEDWLTQAEIANMFKTKNNWSSFGSQCRSSAKAQTCEQHLNNIPQKYRKKD